MNSLAHLKEFQQILADYQISSASQQLLQQIPFVAMTAATSSGRNTVIRELVKTGQYYFIVSDTTRQPRTNDGVPEQDGVEYRFRSEEEVLEDLRHGKYVEAELIHNQQVSGISVRELLHAHEQKRIAVTDMDIGGIHNVIKAKPDTVAILLLPPSFEEWQRRIKHRGNMPQDEFVRRLETACTIFADALEHDYFCFVVNDRVEHAVEQVHHLARFGTEEPEGRERGKRLAEQLYIETTAYLRSLPKK
jgi:guanylate kinase